MLLLFRNPTPFDINHQISHTIFTATCFLSLELDLASNDDFHSRPDDTSGLMKAIPASFYDEAWKGKTTRKGKDKEDAAPTPLKSGFFKDAQISEQAVVDRIKAFKTIIDSKSKIKKDTVPYIKQPSRESPELAARVCAVTSAHWPSNSANTFRDFGFFCRIGVLEHFMVTHVAYRQALMESSLGEVRLKLKKVLDPCVTPYVMEVPGSAELEKVHDWRFIDGLPTPTRAIAKTILPAQFRAHASLNKARHANITFLKSLRAKVDSNPGAWSVADDGEADKDRDLDHAVNYHLHELLQSFWTNMERTLYRAGLDDPDAEYDMQKQTPMPQEIFTRRGTQMDQNTILDVSDSRSSHNRTSADFDYSDLPGWPISSGAQQIRGSDHCPASLIISAEDLRGPANPKARCRCESLGRGAGR